MAATKLQDHVGSTFVNRVAANKDLRLNREKLESGDLGYSQAEKGQRIRGAQDATQTAVANALGDTAEIGTLAGGVGGGSGDFTKKMMNAALLASEQAQKTTADIETESALIAEKRATDTREAMNKQRDEAQDTIGKILPAAGQAVAAGASGGGSSAIISALMTAMCWVAREVLPGQWRDCRTYILFGAPKWFRTWYVNNGEKTAEWLRAHPWAKLPLRPLFLYFAWRGRKMAQKNPLLVEAQSDLL